MRSNKANNNNNEKQAENFTTVWDSVRRAKTVNGLQFKAIDKLLYSYLLGWQVSKDDPNNKKVTKVNSSVRELQQELGVSKGTIETSLKTLEKMGLIVIKSGGVGFSNEYEVRKFSDVESTNVEIKVDQFMENRKDYREKKALKEEPATKQELKIAKPIKPDIQPNKNFDFDEFLLSCDAEFEEYSKPIKLVSPTKQTNYQEYGRKCKHCYQNPNGDWDCADSYCNNHIPF